MYLQIVKPEVIFAINNIKGSKLPGSDRTVKLLAEVHLEQFWGLLNGIYRIGEIPKEWLMSLFIQLPKKKLVRNL